MQSEKKKDKNDTWTTEELQKHLMVAKPDVHQEDKMVKERRHHQEEGSATRKESQPRNRENGPEKKRREDKESHRPTDSNHERRRERHSEKDKERHRERDGRKERDQDKLRDLDREKETYRRAEKERETERKSKQKDPYFELEHKAKAHGYKDEAQYRRRETKEMLERKEQIEDRERKHKEKNEKEERARENSGRKDKYEKSLENKDEKREGRHRQMTEQEQMSTGKDQERRHRKELENPDGDQKRRHRREYDQEHDGGRKLRHSREGNQDKADKNLEEKSNDRKRGDRAFLDAGMEQRERKRKDRGQSQGHERNTYDKERGVHRRREKITGQVMDVGDSYDRHAEGELKNPIKEREDKRKLEIEKEDILVNNPQSPDAVYEDSSTNYEEDFEDYDDDFEDDDDVNPELKQEDVPVSKTSEIAEIQKAINAENDRIASISSRLSQKTYQQEQRKESPNLPNKGSHRGVFIDFISAKQRQISRKMADKQKKRSTELLRLIDMDFSITFCLLDLSPVNEYDMYIRSFGNTNSKQAYVQCNEDYVEREIQTDQIETEEKWTQYPGEGARVSGGPTNADGEFADKVSLPKVDSQRLANFLRSACQVVAVLLEEDHAERQSSWKLKSQEASLSISDGCFQLNTNVPFLHDRKVCCLHFSQVQRHVLLSVHGLPTNPGAVRLSNKYIICVWNIWEPSTPLKILVSESEVKCCCFSPGKVTLVFAGTVDGSVVLWDLREDSSMHHCMKIADSNWVFRSSTFSTDGVLTAFNHTCPVQAIEPISTTVRKEKVHDITPLTSEEEVSSSSFQMASLDENGSLNLWVVMELQKVDLAGSQSDLGLIPGGKVKLVYSSTVNLIGSFFSKALACLGIPQTLSIKFLPLDSNHFIVGTDIGLVCHGIRYGSRVPPKLYKPQQRGTRPIKVTAVDFSPFGEPIFLVGCFDGSIRLHMISDEYPIMQWNDSTNGQPIIALQWSLTKPSVFFVLDAASSIYIWDLLESDLQPVAKDTAQSDKVITMAVLGEPEKNNGLSGLALAKESGTLEIQYIKRQWATAQPEEPNKLHLLLHEAM